MNIRNKVRDWIEQNRNTKLIEILNKAKTAQIRLALARRVRYEDLKKPITR